jgi:chromosomal replication initiation ATPase DnaA
VYRKNNPVVFEEPFGPHRPQVRGIIRLVAESHGLTPEIIKGERRCRVVVGARYEAIREIVRFYPEWTLPRIGRELNKDHTSILHALRKLGLRP